MFNQGDRVVGTIYNNAGDEVQVEGAFLFRTDDPEEMIQDIVIRTDAGEVVYIDEQVARPAPKNDGPLTAQEAADFRAGNLDMDGDLYDRLYAYYTSYERGDEQMPYGTAKARDGDPNHFIFMQLSRKYGN